MNLTKMHEWALAATHARALKEEDYATCDVIQKEVDRRIASNSIDKQGMLGFVYYNPETKKFEGEPVYTNLNELFKNYKP